LGRLGVILPSTAATLNGAEQVPEAVVEGAPDLRHVRGRAVDDGGMTFCSRSM
jgi:hypothetical protein